MPKRPRDEHAPKRPQSSYFLYSNQRRKELKSKNPDKKVTELSKIIAAEWSKMTDAEKKPFEKDAQELKAKYDSDFQKYKETKDYKDFQDKLKSWKKEGNGPSSKRGTKTKRMSDPNAPKKSQTAYFLFINDRRPKLKEKNPDKKLTEISKLLGAEWKEMDKTEKKKWEEKAALLKAEYEKEMERYKKTPQYAKFQEKLKENKKRGGKKKKEETSEESESESGSDESSEEKPKRKTKGRNTKTKGKSESDGEEDDEEEEDDSD